MSIVYLNGQFVLKDQAMVSVFDRGFLFGDGVYEVIPVYEQCLFSVEEHLTRLRRSLEQIDITLNQNDALLVQMMAQLLHHNGMRDDSIYLQVTRGVEPTRQHCASADITPTIFACCLPHKRSTERHNGLKASIEADIRWQRCDIKAITLLANSLYYTQAQRRGIDDVILVRNGYVTEGVMSNIFIVKNSIIATPPADNFILPGISRQILISLAHTNELPLVERMITVDELFTADEIWTTNSTKEIAAITEVDGKPVQNGQPGPVGDLMYSLFQDYKSKYIREYQTKLKPMLEAIG